MTATESRDGWGRR